MFSLLSLGLTMILYQDRDESSQRQRAEKEVQEEYENRFGRQKIVAENLWPVSNSLAKFCEEGHPHRFMALSRLLRPDFTPPAINNENGEEILSALVDTTRLITKLLEDARDRQAVVDRLIGLLEHRWKTRRTTGLSDASVLRSVIDALAGRWIVDLQQRKKVIGILELLVTESMEQRKWKLCRSAIVCLRQIDREGQSRRLELLRSILGGEKFPLQRFPEEINDLPEVKRAAIDALADVGYSERRQAAVEEVGRLKKDRATAAEIARKRREIDREDVRWRGIAHELIGALREKESSIRQSAARALARIGPTAAGAISPLSERLDPRRESSFEVRLASVVALKRIGLNYDAVTALLKALNDRDPDFQDVAAEALERVGEHYVDDVLPAVNRGLDEFDAEERAAREQEPASTAAVESQEDKDARARRVRAERVAVQVLAWNLAKQRDRKEIADRLAEFLHDEDPIVRERSAAALLGLGGEANKYFIKAMGKGNRKETRYIAADRIGEIAKGQPVEVSKVQFDDLMSLFDDPDPALLVKASDALTPVIDNLVSKLPDKDETLRTMSDSVGAAIARLKPRGAEFQEVVTSLELRKNYIDRNGKKRETAWEAFVNFCDQANKSNPYIVGIVVLVLFAGTLWMSCGFILCTFYVARPHWIVSFREWIIAESRKKKSMALFRHVCYFLQQPVSPVRWWDRNDLTFNRWVSRRLPIARKSLGIDEGIHRNERVAICSGEPCNAIQPGELDGKIAQAFSRSKSGLLILGKDTASLDWLTTYVARWAIGDRKSGLAADAVGPNVMLAAGRSGADGPPPMFPVIIKENELVDVEHPIPQKLRLRQHICRVVGELVGVKPAISRELHNDLVVNRRLLVICVAEARADSKLAALMQENYKDWVVISRDVGPYEANQFAHKITIMKVRPDEKYRHQYRCDHPEDHWGFTIDGTFSAWRDDQASQPDRVVVGSHEYPPGEGGGQEAGSLTGSTGSNAALIPYQHET